MRGLAVCGLVGILAGCGGSAVTESVEATVATMTPARGAVSAAGADAAPVTRVAGGREVATGDEGLARLTLDDGPRLLLDAATRLAVGDASTITLSAGRVFARADEGEALALHAGDARLRVADASVSVRVDGAAVEAYVVRGEVSFVVGDHRGVASAGQELRLGGAEPTVGPAALWTDWTGGLARPGPGELDAQGVGVLEARVPDEIGLARWPLVVRRLDVRVTVQQDLAVTEVDQEFFNPASEVVEGLYRVRVPEGAVLHRFAVDRDGRLVDGYVKERQQARQQYEQQVYRGSTEDPALLEWDAPGAYRARIYPIAAGQTRRIVIRYAEWLSRPAPDAPRLYRYPMGGGARAPHVQEMSFAADLTGAGAGAVRASHGARVEEDAVLLRRSDFRPRTDLWLELVDGPDAVTGQRAFRAPHRAPRRAPGTPPQANEADERDYWYLPLSLPASAFPDRGAGGIDLVIVADVSAATDRSHLELGRSVVEALSTHLRAEDRVAIVASDLSLRAVGGEPPALGAASAPRMDALLDELARTPAGGASDLGATLTQAASLLEPGRPGAVVYVGDGAPTVGEMGGEELLDRMGRLPRPARLYAVAVGADSDLSLLSVLTRGGGLSTRVTERAQAADAALSILAHASRPHLSRVEVSLGTGIDAVFPRRAVDVVAGEVLSVVGRVREEPPASVTVRGLAAGQPFEVSIPVRTGAIADEGDLRLRWAGERLRQLLLEGAGREEVADLGVRYGLITPYTSFYVPSRNELASVASPRLPQLRTGAILPLAPIVALGGCLFMGGSDEDEQPVSSSSPATAEEANARWAQPEVAEETVASDDEASPHDMPTADPAPPPAQAPATTVPTTPAPSGGDGFFGGEQQGQTRSGELERNEQPMRARAPAGSTRAPMPEPVAEPEPDEPMDRAASSGRRGPGAGFDRGGSGGHIGTGAEDLGDASALFDGEEHGEGEGLAFGANQRDNDATGAHEVDALAALRALGYEERGRVDDARNAGVLGGLRGDTALGRDPTGALADLFERGSRSETGVGDLDLRIRIRTSTRDHRPRRCSDAANLLLDGRRALWSERLDGAGGLGGMVGVYRRAAADCELPGWRDRRALLDLMLARAGGVRQMVALYHMMSTSGARGYLRSAIRRRVRTPDDMRAVREAFGLAAGLDWELVEQILARQTTPAGRIRALRQLIVEEHPDSFELRLRLLELLEREGRAGEARRLADQLRADPMADAGVRTAVGEMYLRLGDEPEARRVFSEIVEFAPHDELARRRLGDLYRAHGWFDDAYRQYETLSTIRPDDPSVLLLLAQAAAGAGRVDEALRLEERLMQTAEPGAAQGLPRVALLWSSVRLALLRAEARAAGDDERLRALASRMRRMGVERGAGALRVSLVWSHPDAGVSLWVSHPGLPFTRPADLAPDLGIEALDLAELEAGRYRFEVRRAGEHLTAVEARLVVVWNEGRADEQIEVVPLVFDREHDTFAWTLEGRTLSTAQPNAGGR